MASHTKKKQESEGRTFKIPKYFDLPIDLTNLAFLNFLLAYLHAVVSQCVIPPHRVSLSACKLHKKAKWHDVPHFPKPFKISLDERGVGSLVVVF